MRFFYPTGGGVGLIGMWKAFAELEDLVGPARQEAAHDRDPIHGLCPGCTRF